MKKQFSLKDLVTAQMVLRNVDDGAGGGVAPAPAPPEPKPTPKAEPLTLTEAQKAMVANQVKDAVTAAQSAWVAEQEAKAAEQNGEWKKLYDDLKPKFDAQEAELAELRKVVDEEIESRAKDLPEGLKPIYEMVGKDRTARLQFLVKAGEVKELGAPPPPTPPEGDKKKLEELAQEATRARMATGLYS